MKNYLVIILVLSACFLKAQKNNKVFFEGGVVINKPIQEPIKYKMNQPINIYGGFAANTCYGHYFKAGMDFKLLKYKAFSLELPVGISYKSVNSKTWSGGMQGCDGPPSPLPFFYNVTTWQNVKSADVSFGIQPKFDVKRFSIGGNFMLSTFVNLRTQSRYHEERMDFGFGTKSSAKDINMNVACSYGFESLYSVNSRFSLGPKCDFFYARFYKRPDYILQDRMGAGRAVWFTPGIKMSYSLSNKAK